MHCDKLDLCLWGRVVNIILTYDKVSNNVIFYFVCTLMMRIHIAKLIQAHLNWSSMGCLHQSEIKHRSLTWYTARSSCPPFAKVGPYYVKAKWWRKEYSQLNFVQLNHEKQNSGRTWKRKILSILELSFEILMTHTKRDALELATLRYMVLNWINTSRMDLVISKVL